MADVEAAMPPVPAPAWAGGRAGRLSVWPPLPPTVYARRPRPLPFPLQEPDCRLFALGRHALGAALGPLGLTPGDEVLVPAYHHGSEVEALARHGLSCRFYGGDERLAPAERELETLVGARTRALLLIHYLGFPQETGRWRRWCDEQRLLLLEDAAQAWLAEDGGAPVGSLGDAAIFCLYKTFGLGDGAALLCRPAAPPPRVRRARDVVGIARRHAAWARARLRLPLERQPERDASAAGIADFEQSPPVGPVPGTAFLLRRLGGDVPARRRRAYARLAGRLGDRLSPPFDVLPPGASPFVFPLETSARDSVLRWLDAAGVHAFAFWSSGHPLLGHDRFADVERRRAQTIGLPVHQELRSRDLDRIADVAEEALAEAER